MSATAKVARNSNRGSKPGERRGGRQAGSLNKATADVRIASQAYTAEAIEALATIMSNPDQPAAARVSAATALLDRGHGKSRQPITGEGGYPPLVERSKVDLSRLSLEQLRAVASIRLEGDD